MKTISKIFTIAVAATTLAACSDLDTKYLGGEVTSEQKEEVLEKDPSKAMAAVSGCFAVSNSYELVYANHFDFGLPAIFCGLNLQGNEFICKYTGYNWFQYWQGYTGPTSDGTPAGMMWYYMYKQILPCNTLIPTISDDTDVPELQMYLAQGKLLRAYDYFMLAQTFQYTYASHKNAPCVPLILDTNSEQIAADGGAPRATVEEVYAQIMADINSGIELIAKSGLTPAALVDSKPNRMFSLAAAYGLKARVALVMNDWDVAANAAQQAISNFSGRPYTIAEVSKPAFASASDPSWMLCVPVAETDRVVTSGIVNWPSHNCTFADGYVNIGAWKYMSEKLFNSIPNSDVRKGWFLNASYTSPNLTEQQQTYLNDFIGTPIYDSQDNSVTIFPYTNVKFDSYQSVLEQGVNSNDIPMMRVEEMYYILAEAQAMAGNVAQGKQTLENFVKTYRNPNFSAANLNTKEEVQEECYQQRRVELWGEAGINFFDMMRLEKGLDRRGSTSPAIFNYVLAPDAPQLIYCIPREEMTANPLIGENNPESSRPVPVVE